MIRTEAIAFNAFQVNTYLVWDETGDCLVVDPAFYSDGEKEEFEAIIAAKGLAIKGMINTHCHVDHVLGIRYMKSKHGCSFRAHRDEGPVVESVPMLGELFGWRVEPLEGIDEFLEDNESVTIGNHTLLSIHVPGHSMGSLAFYSSEGRFVITGDALFQGSIGRTDLPGGDYDTLIESIRKRLMVLPPETVVHPGHGPSTSIGKEAAENPFLRGFL
jgi:hydroxyacylglutathione hydrolase